MGDIKGEILSLSEKYSIKCLETASLEEKVETQHRSLQQANQRVFQLDARWETMLETQERGGKSFRKGRGRREVAERVVMD